MSTPYIGEIRLFPFFRGAPQDWQLCDGSLLQISEYTTLFNVLGTKYGGDGSTTFGVPDLRGRVPIHQGTGTGLSTYALGQSGGNESVTLNTQQMASHFHLTVASTAAGTSTSPGGNVPATVSGVELYMPVSDATSPYPLPNGTIGVAGGTSPHDNTAPTLTLNYCISLSGIYPAQS